MTGWKTKVGGGLLVVVGVLGGVVTLLGLDGLSWSDALTFIGSGLGVLGLGHKFDKLGRALDGLRPMGTAEPRPRRESRRAASALLVVGAAVALSVAACATPQVSMPVGVAAVMYGNARADYATAKVLVTQGCAGGKLDAAACEAARQIDLRAQVYKTNIEKALTTPEQPVDWSQILQYSESVVGLLLKLGQVP